MKRTTKATTKKSAKKLDPELARIIRGMRGGAAQIAAVGKLSRTYVWKVLHFEKPPSMRFLLALDCVLAGAKRRLNGAILRHAHPEIDSEFQMQNSRGEA
jgi:hypothetical protein